MLPTNFFAILTAALAPLITGFIWYHPKVFGTVWMKIAGVSEDKIKKSNMLFIFLFSIFLSILIGMFLQFVTIHQFGALGMIGGDETLAKTSYTAFMKEYRMAYRSFGHGALHSFMTGIFFVFPLFGINAAFERKTWKYVMLNAGYWTITITIMGGIICGWYALDGFNFTTPK